VTHYTSGRPEIAWRKAIGRLREVVGGQPDLLEIIATLGPPRRFPGCLHRRQQERDQNPDDRDDHQQFHQRKRTSSLSIHSVHCQNSGQKRQKRRHPLTLAGHDDGQWSQTT
jgi:hypothetical protein